MASLIDRIARLESAAARPTVGKYLAFQVAAYQGTTPENIVTFLRDRGHSIGTDDEVFLMNLGAHTVATGDPIRDLSTTLLTEEERAAAPMAGQWPEGRGWFTFKLASPALNA